jgi:ABC-type transport system involved in multi-copper enzyme maturation permease subunit
MFWLIAKKDFLLNLISARFIIGFLLCIVIIPFTVIVSVDNYLGQVQGYKVEKERSEKEFKEIRVWSALRPTVVSEPAVLSIFSNGISNNMGNTSRINLGVYPLFPSGNVIMRDNPLLNSFFSTDFSKVMAILISLIALVFSYDAITREREDGTMKLTLTSRTSRITFLIGKLTGLLITLLPILLFCYILACLIVMVNPEISISASDWKGILLLFLTSIIYMLVFILIGLLISSLVSRSSSSIILSLLCWIWFLSLLPNISTYLSQSIVKTPLFDNVQIAMNEFDKDIREELGFMRYAPTAYISALSGQRVPKLFDLIKFVVEKASYRIPTPILNDFIRDIVAFTPPPTDKGNRLKILYATQVSVKPPKFRLFVNNPELFHFSYKRYVENQLRKAFGFEGTSIWLDISKRGEDD